MSSETHEIAHDLATHPTHSTKTYWVLGGVLAILTILEILLYYAEDEWHLIGGGTAAWLIIALSTLKFVLVVMFYMHLKYDSRIFTGLFLFPFLLAMLVVAGLWILYHILPSNRIIGA